MVSLRRLSLPWGLLGEPDMDINLPLELQVLLVLLKSGPPAGCDLSELPNACLPPVQFAQAVWGTCIVRNVDKGGL